MTKLTSNISYYQVLSTSCSHWGLKSLSLFFLISDKTHHKLTFWFCLFSPRSANKERVVFITAVQVVSACSTLFQDVLEFHVRQFLWISIRPCFQITAELHRSIEHLLKKQLYSGSQEMLEDWREILAVWMLSKETPFWPESLCSDAVFPSSTARSIICAHGCYSLCPLLQPSLSLYKPKQMQSHL